MVVLKSTENSFASGLLVFEDFDVLRRHIEGNLEEAVDTTSIFYATSELPRTGFCAVLVLIDTYQQREDGTIGGTVCQ